MDQALHLVGDNQLRKLVLAVRQQLQLERPWIPSCCSRACANAIAAAAASSGAG